MANGPKNGGNFTPTVIEAQGITGRERALGHQKAATPTVGIGEPQPGEGSEGDFTLRKVTSAKAGSSGLVLYIKWGNIWYDVNNLGKPKTWDEI